MFSLTALLSVAAVSGPGFKQHCLVKKCNATKIFDPIFVHLTLMGACASLPASTRLVPSLRRKMHSFPPWIGHGATPRAFPAFPLPPATVLSHASPPNEACSASTLSSPVPSHSTHFQMLLPKRCSNAVSQSVSQSVHLHYGNILTDCAHG